MPDNRLGRLRRTTPIRLGSGHLEALRGYLIRSDGSFDHNNIPRAYKYIKDFILDIKRAAGEFVDKDTEFWFEQAVRINANDGAPADVIRTFTSVALRNEGLTSPDLGQVSDLIGERVLRDIITSGEILPFPQMLARDIRAALNIGGRVRDLSAWGGSFYYWDVPYPDETGKVRYVTLANGQRDYHTIGEEIVRQGALGRFIRNSSDTLIELAKSSNAEANIKDGIRHPAATWEAFEKFKSLPNEVRRAIWNGAKQDPAFREALGRWGIKAGDWIVDAEYGDFDDIYREMQHVQDRLEYEYRMNLAKLKNNELDVKGAIIDGFLNQDGGQLGFALGSTLGRQLSKDPLIQVVASGTLSTMLAAIGEVIDERVFGGTSSTNLVGPDSRPFGEALSENLLDAGIGAVSSYLTAELINGLGVTGLPAEIGQNLVGGYLTAVIRNLPALASGSKSLGEVLRGVNVATIVGSFVGTKLASEIYRPQTVGGQLGSAVGAVYGGFQGAAALSAAAGSGGYATAIAFASANPVAAVAIVAAIVLIDTLLGSLIGSLFGGTPRTGADVAWDPVSGGFVVANSYGRKGGSRETAVGIAEAVAESFNAVYKISGSLLLDPKEVQSGNYGTRKSQFVYRPISSREKDAITARFEGSAAPQKLINHGVYLGLSTMVNNLAGGDLHVKRALSSTLDNAKSNLNSDGSGAASTFELQALLGDLVMAQDYALYLQNTAAVNALIASDPQSAFAAGWAVTLTRAVELGLNRRNPTDWTGGFEAWLDELDDGKIDGKALLPTQLAAAIDESTGGRYWAALGVDQNFLGMIEDTIETADYDWIEGTAGADLIDLRSGQIRAGLTVNGAALAAAKTIDVAATVDGGDGWDVIHASDNGDNLIGGAGRDALYGGRLDDWLIGGDDGDWLFAGNEAGGLGGDGNYLDGGAGDDILYGREGSDWLEGGDGNDLLDAGDGDDILAGGAGVDTLKGGRGNDQYILRVGDGLDTADETASVAIVNTEAAVDPIQARLTGIANGTIARNWLGDAVDYAVAAQLNQRTLATGAARTVAIAPAAAGDDDAIVFGLGIGIGDIRLKRDGVAGDQPDLLVQVMTFDPATGGEVFTGTELRVKDWFTDPFKRVEWLKFADGNEIRIGDIRTFIVGTAGDDILNGTNGNDFVYGGDGNDQIKLLDGDDIGNGGTGDDIIWGDGDKDLLIGGLGNDKLFGGTAADVLSGDDGDDELMGDDGDDVLSGGRGNDIIAGGKGRDTIKFSRGDGRDRLIIDASEVDPSTGTWETVWDEQNLWNEDLGYSSTTAKSVWGGDYRYNHTLNAIQRFTGTVNTAVISSRDNLEFALGINLQDVVLGRDGANLVLAVGRENGELGRIGDASDSVTIKGWYNSANVTDWSSSSPVGKFVFYQTGVLDVFAEGWTVIGGSDGNDGTAGAALRGGAGRDWISGGAGDDVLAGGLGADILMGNSGQDIVHGEFGEDVLYGGSGDDILVGGGSGDILIGGDGFDTASYFTSSAGVRAFLGAPSANTGDARDDTYFGVEGIEGTAYDDTLGGDDGDNELTGGAGRDTLQGGAGDDTYIWKRGDGADVIEEGAFSILEAIDATGALQKGFEVDLQPTYEDTVPPTRTVDLTITYGSTVIYSHTVYGQNTYTNDFTAWPSQGYANAGAGFQLTGDGKQVTRQTRDQTAAAGSDTLEFGPGISLGNLSFARSAGNLTITVDGDPNSRITILGQDTDRGRIEFLQFADGLSTSLAGVLLANAAAPHLVGNSGTDLLVGDAQSNKLFGGYGSDVLSGGAGNDELYGEVGDDILEGGAGADVLNGGVNSSTDVQSWGDTARYASSAAGVWVELTRTVQRLGDAEGDSLLGIENVTGSQFNDGIYGDAGGNRINGLDGDDTLYGNDGDDVLIGGAGADILDGGTGDDNISGGSGDDRIYAGAGNDLIDAGEGNDRVEGGTGDDTIVGGSGNDVLYGQTGADMLSGGDGNDGLDGGEGDDTLSGGSGNDYLSGGLGNDDYLFEAGSGQDVIEDYVGGNRILLKDATSEQVWLTRSGADLVVQVIGDDRRITVKEFYNSGSSKNLYSIVTADRTTYTKYAEPLIAAMTQASATAPKSTDAVPQNIVGMREALLAIGPQKPVAANLIPDLGLISEARWTGTTGPYGTAATVLQTGQLDDTVQGGGTYATGGFAVDPNRTYEFTTYFRADSASDVEVYFGLSSSWERYDPATGQILNGGGYVELGDSGAETVNPYFVASSQGAFTPGKWYRFEGVVLPRGTPLVSNNVHGGIFDTETGQKVRDTQVFRWNDAMPSGVVSARFFNFGGSQKGYFSSWYQPAVEVLPAVGYSSGMGLAVEETGLVGLAASPAVEATPTPPVSGEVVDAAPAVAAGFVNKAPTISGATEVILTETGLGSKPANAGTLVAELSVSDPEGDATRLEFAPGGNPNGWFFIDGNQIKIKAGAQLDFEALRAAGASVADRDGNGSQEVGAADILVRATDGSLTSANWRVGLRIEDVNEAPVFNPSQTYLEIAENRTVGSQIGQLQASDPEGQPVTFELVAGSYDNASFSLSGSGVLSSNAVYDYESQQAYTIDVRARDATGLTTTRQLTIGILDVNEGGITPALAAPIVLDLDEDGVELVSLANSKATFDMDGDGKRDRTGWVGADDGFLVYDRDGNGRIDRLNEISFTLDLAGAKSDLEGLRAFDTNKNGAFDVGDEKFASFAVWRDENQDGKSQSKELKTLAEWHITSIDLRLKETGAAVEGAVDNVLFATSGFVGPTGRRGEVGDVFLAYEAAADLDADGRLAKDKTVKFSGLDDAKPLPDKLKKKDAAEKDKAKYAVDGTLAPIVLDLDGDGIELVGVEASTATFDVDGDGKRDATGWVGSDDGFLVYDRDGNGMIDTLAELSFALDLTKKRSDPTGLRVFDTNGNGAFDAGDEKFSSFAIWRDANQDGISQTGEIRTLAEWNITAIDLETHETGDVIEGATDNVVFARSQWVNSTWQNRQVADVFLAYKSAADVDSDGKLKKDKTIKFSGIDGAALPDKLKKPKDDKKSSGNATIGPVVIDLDGDGVELTSFVTSKVRFDMDNDGLRERTGWAGADDGLLALDWNGNGLIDDATEISFRSLLPGAASDLEGLAALDGNANGLIDAGDAAFARLSVWQDANQDGITDAGELRSLVEAGITSISLAGVRTGSMPSTSENVVFARTVASLANGSTAAVEDVFFTFETAPDAPSESGAAADDAAESDAGPSSALTAEPVVVASRSMGRKFKDFRLHGDGGYPVIRRTDLKGTIAPDAGQLGAATILTFSNKTIGVLSTIVLDLNGDGIETKRWGKTRAGFDMDGNGGTDDTGWVSGGDGFLVADIDGDGRITGPGELSLLGLSATAQSSRDALATLDSNGDRVIDAKDKQFEVLRVWVDANANGRTDAGELKSLADLGITSFNLAARATGQSSKLDANLIAATATFARADGSLGTAGDTLLTFKPGAAPAVTRGTTSEMVEREDLLLGRDGLDGPGQRMMPQMRLDGMDAGLAAFGVPESDAQGASSVSGYTSPEQRSEGREWVEVLSDSSSIMGEAWADGSSASDKTMGAGESIEVLADSDAIMAARPADPLVPVSEFVAPFAGTAPEAAGGSAQHSLASTSRGANSAAPDVQSDLDDSPDSSQSPAKVGDSEPVSTRPEEAAASNLAAERKEPLAADTAEVVVRGPEVDATPVNPAAAAAELLRRPPALSLNVSEGLARRQQLGTGTGVPTSTGPNGANLDKLIAAMAAFQEGQGMGAMALTGTAPLETVMAQLAPAA